MTNLRETGRESFPLLLQTLEKESSRNVCGCESRHSKVSSGVALILGRWPGNITAGCISAILLTFVIFATVLMILTILIITHLNGNIAHRMIIKRETALLEIDTSCDYRQQQDGKIIYRRTTKYSPDINLFDVLLESSLILKRDILNDTQLHQTDSFKGFFISSEGTFSRQEVCSIESAARSMPNNTFYLIVFTSNKELTSDKEIDDLVKFYGNIKVFHLPGHKYFRDSPIGDILENSKFDSSLINFAARVLTLWRYGGMSFDTNLITVNKITGKLFSIPHEHEIMLSDSEARIMSVRV
ncbi:hypothetical protein L9F63_012448, partial [Diploptera punctata]